MSTADRLRQARLDAGLAQEELAVRSGVKQPNIAAYESGRRIPSVAMVERILAASRPRPSVLLARNREQVRTLAARNSAIDIRVFGSVARGDDSTDSDLDLIVTFEPGASLLDQVGLVADLEELLGVPVDVISERALLDRDSNIRAESVPV